MFPSHHTTGLILHSRAITIITIRAAQGSGGHTNPNEQEKVELIIFSFTFPTEDTGGMNTITAVITMPWWEKEMG